MYNYINILYLYVENAPYCIYCLFTNMKKSVSLMAKGTVSMDYIRTDVGIWCYMVATAMCGR